MNLAKLLSTGKSFFSGYGPPAYRETKRGFVPKFNSDKNPFAPKAVTETKDPAPAAVPVPVQEKRLTSARTVRTAKWAERLNPFRAPAPARSLIRAEQPELSLDTVKVLQNDLAEADIERVPAKSRTLPPAPVSSAAGAWELAASAR